MLALVPEEDHPNGGVVATIGARWQRDDARFPVGCRAQRRSCDGLYEIVKLSKSPMTAIVWAMTALAPIHDEPGVFGVTMSAAEFRGRIGEAMDAVQREPVTVTNRGRARAVLVSVDFYERALAALEDDADIAAAAEARADDGPRVTQEELLADLGLAV